MNSLKSFQLKFSNVIRENQITKDLQTEIIPGGLYTEVSEPIELHHRGYVARLTEALGETFEAVWWFLGDEDFFKFCEDFISKYPSHFDNLSDYGHEVIVELKKHPLTRDIPFLPDLAQFEWLFKETFHAKPHEFFDPSTVKSNEELFAGTLKLAPSLRLISSNYNVYELWKLRKANQEDVEEIPDSNGHYSYAIFKSQGSIYVHELEEGEMEVIRTLGAGKPVGEALNELEKGAENLTPDLVSQVFEKIFSLGMVEKLIREPE